MKKTIGCVALLILAKCLFAADQTPSKLVRPVPDYLWAKGTTLTSCEEGVSWAYQSGLIPTVLSRHSVAMHATADWTPIYSFRIKEYTKGIIKVGFAEESLASPEIWMTGQTPAFRPTRGFTMLISAEPNESQWRCVSGDIDMGNRQVYRITTAGTSLNGKIVAFMGETEASSNEFIRNVAVNDPLGLEYTVLLRTDGPARFMKIQDSKGGSTGEFRVPFSCVPQEDRLVLFLQIPTGTMKDPATIIITGLNTGGTP